MNLNVKERSLLTVILSNPNVKHPNLQVGYEASVFKNNCFLSPEEVEQVEYSIKDTEHGKREFVNPEKAEALVKEIPASVELAKSMVEAFKVVFTDGYTAEQAQAVLPIMNKLEEIYDTTVVETGDLTK